MNMLRQLGEVRRHPPRLVAGQQLSRPASPRLVLEIEVAERLPVVIADDENPTQSRQFVTSHNSEDR